jgi:hypothetical protein
MSELQGWRVTELDNQEVKFSGEKGHIRVRSYESSRTDDLREQIQSAINILEDAAEALGN